jgi:hypothetical protein
MEYAISLNPKKSIFGVYKGKLLGHIISKDGITIDPSRFEAIKKIPLPKDKKSLQSFFGQINFVGRFILNFAEIVKLVNRVLKKDAHFKWDNEGKLSFQRIKEAITVEPVPVNPNFSKDFIMFSFALKDTIAGVLLQKNDQANEVEQPISFTRKNLTDSKLNYTITEKQAYALVKSLKHFRTYVGYNKIKDFVPYPAVKDVLSQQDFLGSRGKWVSQIQEYDLEIKPSKIIKGQGLDKMMIKSNQEAIEVGEKEQINIINSK